MIKYIQKQHILRRFGHPLTLVCAGLAICLWQPLALQAQTVAPTPLLDAIAGKRPVVTGPVVISKSKPQRFKTRSVLVDDPAEDANDPEDVVPDEPPADLLGGDNDPVVAEGEALELDNGGQIDGIYQCNYQIGEKTLQSYVSVNGKGNGQSIFLIANMAENSLAMSGWGVGQVIDVDGLGYAFVGETDNQLPFEIAVVVDASGQAVAEGTVGFEVQGSKMLAEISCNSIW